MRLQIGAFQKTAKIFHIAVQIAGHQDILRSSQLHQVSSPSRGVLESPNRLMQGLQKTVWVGHGNGAGVTGTKGECQENHRKSAQNLTEQQISPSSILTADTPFAELFFYD